MKNLIFSIFISIILFGCVQNPSFREGVILDTGLYVPYSGNLYGLDLLSYTSGCKIYTPTNTIYSIERQTSSTNSYLGIIQINETSNTKVTYIPKNNEIK